MKIFIFRYILLNLIIVFLSYILKSDVVSISVLSLIQISYVLLCIYRVAPIKLSMGLLFFVILFLFHSGHNILYLQGASISDFWNMTFCSISDYTIAQIFIQLSILIISLGYMMVKVDTQKFSVCSIDQIKKRPFLLFFLFTVPLFVMSKLMQIEVAEAEGYHATYALANNPLFHYGYIFIEICPSLASIMCLLYKDKPKIQFALAAFVIVFGTYTMISGHRISALVQIITFAIVYYGTVADITKKTIVVFLIAGMFYFTFLPMVSYLRTYGQVDMEHMTEMYQAQRSGEEVSDNSFLVEFGGTVVSLIYPMKYAGTAYNYMYGTTYLLEPINILPKKPKFIVETDFYKNAMVFVDNLPSIVRLALGGSILGELYSNFSWFGCLFAFMIGVLLKYVDTAIATIKKYGKLSYWSIMLILWIPHIFMWIRGYFQGFISFIMIIIYMVWRLSLRKK